MTLEKRAPARNFDRPESHLDGDGQEVPITVENCNIVAPKKGEQSSLEGGVQR